MKKEMARLAAGLRAEKMAGRRFALYCLVAARLPGLPDTLDRLLAGALPPGLKELVRCCRDLV